MKEIPHPSSFIDASLTDAIRSVAAEADQAGSLLPDQLQIIYDNKWFNLFVPSQYNGLQLSLPEALKIEEALAWVDGSTGWTVTLCSGANWFIGFLQPALVNSIFNTGKVCLAGSGRSSGIASVTDDGYEVNGYWNYATGSSHATAFTANCLIEKNGVIMNNDDGSPLIKSFIFLKEEVTLYKSWNSIGMKATSSNNFEVKQLRVPENRSFIIDAKYAAMEHPVYQYPFLQFAEATLAVNSSGMAFRFMDLCEQLFAERKKSKNYTTEMNEKANNIFQEARIEYNKTRQLFYEVLEQSWDKCLLNRTIPEELLREVSKQSKSLATTARMTVDKLYPYCGLAAANEDTEMNRVWRNLHTASQHTLLLY